ncbi:hypothetical protein AB0K80_23130 [Streptomyces sp. NPDC052682]|uniref:hypothetical protein n=1 Tax=Streptomyces sp. NPDC052682 TaxID=3154954 RepID=UPI0034133827
MRCAAAPLLQACVLHSVGAALGLGLTWTQVVYGAPLPLATATVIGFRVRSPQSSAGVSRSAMLLMQ